MSNYLATDTDLIAVADAIRVKGGTSSSLSFPDGYVSAIQDIQAGDIYEPIYKSLAYRSVIASSAPGVSEWCDNLSDIKSFMFAGQQFNGDFTFNNVYFVGQYAFAVPWAGNGASITTSYTINFLRSSGTSFGTSPFYNNGMIRGINAPYLSIIGDRFCQSCANLTTLSFPECTSIGNYAFYSCSKLNTTSFPKCTSIGSYAFYSCSKLNTTSFPKCTSIGNYAFYSCANLTTISFPECTSIGTNAFYYCSNLIIASFPECTTINQNAFYNCANLTTISFPKCTSIGSNAFYYCSNLIIASFPKCTTISNSAFFSCANLTTISFPECTSIGTNGFYNCKKLESAYFMGSSIPSIGAYIFANTPMSSTMYLGYYGSIYVPSSLLASYKTATNWVTCSSRMVGI